MPSAPSVPWAVSLKFARVVPYYTPVLLDESRVAHPIRALESETVSATGPLLIDCELEEPDWVEVALVPEGVLP